MQAAMMEMHGLAKMPEAHGWVSSLFASAHTEGTVFISLNGYRNDEFKTYVFMSSDYGKTWKSIKGNLPESVANVIIQDPVNTDLLYCGLDNGTYVSLDKGNTWHFFNAMLNVASYDMMVHPRDNELIVGTHGRSIYIADVKPLQQLKEGGLSKNIMAFTTDNIRYNNLWGEKAFAWDKASEPKATVFYYVSKESPAVSVEIYDEKNVLVRKINTKATTGFNTFTWDVKIQENSSKVKSNSTGALKYAGKGKYKIKLINGAETSETTVEVK
jgi:hypothetical protein